ncbi:MAG: DUF6178 family protein [Desulfobacterales bacterium]|nr:DUF6178 family protein [Desulfobacterales bacterium]MDD4070972.1 DUF6178 family protein [Desulfobacterales bacterium]MDD4394026.1 DUF6178 family protein [Desulfobacterales bacterium]
MTDTIKKAPSADKAVRLYRQRKEILKLSSEKALDSILSCANPTELIRSFPEQDFYFMIHDIGLEDCLPLLSLASDQQWEFIVDIEAWQRDKMEIKSLSKWLNQLLHADSKRFIKWFLAEKTEFIELYLLKNIHVIIREHDQDPSDFDDDYITLDGTYYIKVQDAEFDSDMDKEAEESRQSFLKHFIEQLAAYDHVTYQNVLTEFASVLSAEAEEESYRFRNIRLAEKGFLPFEEAIGVYQPVSPAEVGTMGKKLLSHPRQDYRSAVAQYPANLLNRDNLFTTALSCIDNEDILIQLQSEFAGLCNQIISADLRPIRYREQLSAIVKKAGGYISIGLEQLTGQPGTPDTSRIASLIRTWPLIQIFRIGYGAALKLKWKTERWRKGCWFLKQGLPIAFWGEEWMGVLGGLFVKKPLYFDNYRTGTVYREFSSTADIAATEQILNHIIAFDELFSKMPVLNHHPAHKGFLTFKSLLLTIWARSEEGLSEELAPIPFDTFKRFYSRLFTGKANSDAAETRRTSLRIKESLLHWLSDKTGLTIDEISEKVGPILETLFDEIETEYGRVSEKDLDARYSSMFLVKK